MKRIFLSVLLIGGSLAVMALKSVHEDSRTLFYIVIGALILTGLLLGWSGIASERKKTSILLVTCGWNDAADLIRKALADTRTEITPWGPTDGAKRLLQIVDRASRSDVVIILLKSMDAVLSLISDPQAPVGP